MARIHGTIGGHLSGKLDGLVFVKVGDKTYVRTAPERRKDSWSPKQEQHRRRFQAFTRFYRMHRGNIVQPIWNLSATKQQTGYNLFMKANLPAFNADGSDFDPSLLHYSTGPLDLPQNLMLHRDELNPMMVHVSWNPECITRQERPDDELLIVRGGSYRAIGPIETAAQRKAGSCTFDFTDRLKEGPWDLYLFFVSADRKKYSPDKHFSV